MIDIANGAIFFPASLFIDVQQTIPKMNVQMVFKNGIGIKFNQINPGGSIALLCFLTAAMEFCSVKLKKIITQSIPNTKNRISIPIIANIEF